MTDLLMLPDVAWSFGRHQALDESDVPLGGPGVCAWTGREVTETWPFRPSDGFADWERIGDRHTNRAHPGYAWLAGHHRAPAGRTLGFRRFSLLASTAGLQVSGKDEKHTIREWVLHPPDPPFSILVADQGQKHLAWRTPVAHDTTMFPVRLDERVAWVTPWFTQLLAMVEDLYAAGLTKQDLAAGETRVARFMRLTAGLRDAWTEVKSSRGQVELELAVWLAQKPEEDK